MLTINALAAADSVVIPTQPHYLSAKGLELLLRSVSKVKRQINPHLRIDGIQNLVCNYKGTVWYVEEDGKKTELICRGYDKSTGSLRYGFKPQKHDKRIFRIKCGEDRRIFTPVARSSHKWKRLYKKRTGVERINGRIDRDYQFERHTIRGLDKMKMFLTVTFIVYMTMAKVKVMAGQTEHLCKLHA